jgi:hypothetical protein
VIRMTDVLSCAGSLMMRLAQQALLIGMPRSLLRGDERYFRVASGSW